MRRDEQARRQRSDLGVTEQLPLPLQKPVLLCDPTSLCGCFFPGLLNGLRHLDLYYDGLGDRHFNNLSALAS